jgi:hypothetical protein
MTDNDSPSDQTAPIRARVATWETAFADPSGTGFAPMAAPYVALEGSIFPETIKGREAVFRAMRLAASVYDRLEFVHEAVLQDRTYMEWEAGAFGLEIAGVTVLSIDGDGWLVRIALHHRPFAVVERFSAEFAQRLNAT